ncbi:MAG: ABC transporter permease [Lachnospiraceae bacterium]|nr:ABC transporter permease [Lachnospiraceae bacterium]
MQKTPESAGKIKEPVKEKGRSGFWTLYLKELADHLEGNRLLIIMLMLFVVMLVSLSGTAKEIRESGVTNSQYMFLALITTNSTVYSFASFLAFLGPLAGIVLGFDAINNEQNIGTLNRLASQPIYRDAIINAKFLAGATVILITVAALAGLSIGFGMLSTGIVPTGEEVFRVLVFFVLTFVYISLWLAVAILFSVICRYTATAAIVCLALWLFMTMFMSLAANWIAGALYPISDSMRGYMNVQANYELNLAVNRISPYYLFTEAATTMLNPSVRSIGIMTVEQLSGALSSYLSPGQSLLLIWPHIVVMTAIAAVSFGAAYIVFMRREIRA